MITFDSDIDLTYYCYALVKGYIPICSVTNGHIIPIHPRDKDCNSTIYKRITVPAGTSFDKQKQLIASDIRLDSVLKSYNFDTSIIRIQPYNFSWYELFMFNDTDTVFIGRVAATNRVLAKRRFAKHFGFDKEKTPIKRFNHYMDDLGFTSEHLLLAKVLHTEASDYIPVDPADFNLNKLQLETKYYEERRKSYRSH